MTTRALHDLKPGDAVNEWQPCDHSKPHVAHGNFSGQPCPGISYEDPRFRSAEDSAKRLLPLREVVYEDGTSLTHDAPFKVEVVE